MARCIRGTIVAYAQWLLPLLVLRILPVRIGTGFRWWQRSVAPHRRGDAASRRAAAANFMMLMGFRKAGRWGRRATLELALILFAPVYAMGVGVIQVSRFGRDVRRSHGIGRPRQWLELYALHMEQPAWLFLVEHRDWYYRKRLYETGMAGRAAHSIPQVGLLAATTSAMWIRNQDRSNKPRPSDRKSNQALRLGRAGVPTIPLIATLGQGRLDFGSGFDATNLPDTGLFAKPNTGYQGKGTLAWERHGDGTYRRVGDATQRCHTSEEVLQFLRDQPAEFVLQPRLANHPDLTDLTGDTLCGIRFLTFTDPVTLQARVFPFAWMKIPRAGVIADNIHAPGGLPGMAAGVDMTTGKLGPAFAADLTWRREHPDRGSRIEGRIVPCWKESVALALVAHRVFRPHGWAWGWDIAVTASGPLVIEGNSHPGFYEEFFPGVTFGEVEEVEALINLCLLADQA